MGYGSGYLCEWGLGDVLGLLLLGLLYLLFARVFIEACYVILKICNSKLGPLEVCNPDEEFLVGE